MPVLYIVEQGAQLGLERGRLVVRRNRQTLQAIPLQRVEQVVLLGRIQPTTAALDALLAHHIPLYYLNQRGALKGCFQAPVGKHVLLRRRQYQRVEMKGFCDQVARAIVSAKLANERTACLRWGRDHHLSSADSAAAQLDDLLLQLPEATRPQLLGLEGAGTRAYYCVLRELLSDKLPFGKRSRRPATDPVSALLNFASALLRTQVFTALNLAGLDPYQGFYHTYTYGRPALALDMMEEFRPLLADGVAVAAINRKVIQAEDFLEADAILMTESAIERFVALFDHRLRGELTHPITRQHTTYRQCLNLQARMLAKAVLGELSGYLGFTQER